METVTRTLPRLLLVGILLIHPITFGLPSSFVEQSTHNGLIDSTTAMSTCQCGVFLLGSPPLQFSADATPTLAGNPVSANCTSLPDRSRCANDCQRLVRAMSNQENPILVQTLVLSATKTLACQRFNASAKVPLPRIHIAGAIPWRQEERNMRATDPRWLAGFYRWCDSHWIYAGVSASDPLCCANGLPVRCMDKSFTEDFIPTNTNRNPRLIIKKRPEDDISSEEEQDNDLGSVSSTSSPSTTAESSINDTSMEKLEPFTTPRPETQESTLNSTILAEAFQFVGALMRSVGLADVVEGITTVFPTSSTTELLKKVDVGGWVSKYQNHYIAYGREFNLGYCYMEYGLYNVASEGVGNLVSRVFGKTNRRVRRDNRRSQLYSPNIPQGRSSISRSNPARKLANSTPDRAGRSAVQQPSSQPKSLPAPTSISANSKTSATKKSTNTNTPSTRRQGGGGQQGPNLMNLANILLQIAGNSNNDNNNNQGGGGGGGDKVNVLLQNALPLLGQVATSPMVQGVVSNIVTNFLTPPDNQRPVSSAPPIQQRPGNPVGASVVQNNNNNNNANSEEESNEIEPAPHRPPPPGTGGRPPMGQQDSGLTGMLGQIVQTYLKYYFTNKNQPPPSGNMPSASRPIKIPEKVSMSSSVLTSSGPIAEEKADIVETISEVAKPFFISYFGVVPGLPGFGQLNIAERTGRLRDDTLTYDPDPGASLSDLILGSSHLPSTGNGIFDFGNRVVFAFSRANDPTQGLYCIKQYSVNKLWDGFRFGVKTLFK